uniref:Uncharacterized protein n=1 Tax=Clastoptera arizonana TaxID=38151 RepID=A0A1B6E0V7_9HEMI
MLETFEMEFMDNVKEKPRICFLSGKPRELTVGHSRLYCDFRKEVQETIGPGSYNPKYPQYKVLSKQGYGGLASKSKRFIEEEPIFRSSISLRPKLLHLNCFKPVTLCSKFNKYGFNSSVERKTGDEKKDYIPGFCYDINNAYQQRKIMFHHSFGGRTEIQPHVFIKCTPNNLDTCQLCEQKPLGDYWFKGNTILCRPCFGAQWKDETYFDRSQLLSLKKIRDCSHIHQHENTTAAYPLMEKKEVWKQIVRECYFACYGKSKVSNVKPTSKSRQTNREKIKVSSRKARHIIPSLISIKYIKDHPLVNL